MNADESYSGDSSYKYIDRLIKRGGSELEIISPYISNYYARLLIDKAGSARIRVITSKDSVKKRDALLYDYMSKSTGPYLKALAFFLILDFISMYLKFYYTTLLLTAIAVVIAIAAYGKHRKLESNLLVKVSGKRFIHEKLYINGDTAIVGSANLTYNGMHRNIEHIDITRDPERIAELKDHFESLWGEIAVKY